MFSIFFLLIQETLSFVRKEIIRFMNFGKKN